MKFQKLLRDIILEDARLEHLLNTHAHKDIVKINKETGKKKVKRAPLSNTQMMIIVANDPTSRIDGIESTQTYGDIELGKLTPDMVKKTGEYSQWLIKQYKGLVQSVKTPYGEDGYDDELSENQRLFFEDLYKTKEDLIKFHRFKNTDKVEEADINKYSLSSLETVTGPLSLEMATTTKEERTSSLLHPAAEFVYEDSKWFVAKMSENSPLGKEAAIYYGGSNKRPSENETSWCTSAPGMDYYFTYLKQGPYYVIIDKTDSDKGTFSGLPARRYQFHFESNQFMDASDKQIDFVKFFQDNPELKEAFRDVIKGHFSGTKKGASTMTTTEVVINYPSDGISKLIALYGFEDFFDSLPSTVTNFEIEYKSGGYGNNSTTNPNIEIPKSITRLTNLGQLFLSGTIKSLPENIGDLKNLTVLAVPDNDELTVLPDSIANLIDGELKILLLTNSGIDVNKLSPKIVEALKRTKSRPVTEQFMIMPEPDWYHEYKAE